MRTGTHTQSDVRVSARERENVAGRARGRELRERGRMVVTVRIISDVSSHSNISVGAVTFRNTGEVWSCVNTGLVSDMAESWPQHGPVDVLPCYLLQNT